MTDDDIEQLVATAASDGSQLSRKLLFHAISCVEVFFPYRHEQHDGREVRSTPLARLADGTHAMMLFTSKLHPHLSEHQQFAGGTFNDALSAALKMPSLDWVFLLNRESQRVAIAKGEIPEILEDIHSAPQIHSGAPASARNEGSAQSLEELITSTVNSKSAELPASLGSVIGDKQLFLELSKMQSEDGRPVMHTFQVEHLGPVIRAYTSRIRPGITYGGMLWPELKNMIRISPNISGLQIVNDDDDWIVLDREALGLASNPET